MPALAQSTDRPRRDGILHESDRRADRVEDAELDQILLDEILAFEMRDARPLVGVGDGRIDRMPDPGSLRGVGGNDPPTGLPLRPGFVAPIRNIASTSLAAFTTDAASPRSPVTTSAPADARRRAATLSGLRVSAMTRCPLDSRARATAPPC